MADLNSAFKSTVAPFNEQPIGGNGTLDIWRAVFGRMRHRLEADNATAEEIGKFKAAIITAIDTASAAQLNDDERAALRDTLRTAFGEAVMPTRTDLAPKANFLDAVRFPV